MHTCLHTHTHIYIYMYTCTDIQYRFHTLIYRIPWGILNIVIICPKWSWKDNRVFHGLQIQSWIFHSQFLGDPPKKYQPRSSKSREEEDLEEDCSDADFSDEAESSIDGGEPWLGKDITTIYVISKWRRQEFDEFYIILYNFIVHHACLSWVFSICSNWGGDLNCTTQLLFDSFPIFCTSLPVVAGSEISEEEVMTPPGRSLGYLCPWGRRPYPAVMLPAALLNQADIEID